MGRTKKATKGGVAAAKGAVAAANGGVAAASSPTLRSQTVDQRMKADMDKKDKEIMELKRKLEGQEAGKKKARTEVKHVVKKKTESKGVWLELKEAVRSDSYNHIKFLNSTKDEVELMLLTLPHTTMWDEIKNLSEQDQWEEAKSYVEVYGPQMTAEVNKERSQHQSNIRSRWLALSKTEMGSLTAGQLLKVARRNPKHLQFLDEEGGTPEVNQKNKEVNQQNKKYRDRFKAYITLLVPTCVATANWSEEMMATEILSDCKDEKTGDDMVPAAVEAMVILFVENNQDKWQWQSGVLRHHKNVQEFKEELKEKLKAENREPTKEEKEPLPKYSSSKSGAKSYGGWSDEGKKRHRFLEKMIEQGRALDTTKDIEEFFRDEIFQDLQERNKKLKAKKVEVEEEESDEDEEPDCESCDSDEEAEQLQKFHFYSAEELEKQKQEQEQKQEEQKKKEQEEAEKERALAAQTEEDEDDSGANAHESNGHEQEKENEQGAAGNGKGGKKAKKKASSPPTQLQQPPKSRPVSRNGSRRGAATKGA